MAVVFIYLVVYWQDKMLTFSGVIFFVAAIPDCSLAVALKARREHSARLHRPPRSAERTPDGPVPRRRAGRSPQPPQRRDWFDRVEPGVRARGAGLSGPSSAPRGVISADNGSPTCGPCHASLVQHFTQSPSPGAPRGRVLRGGGMALLGRLSISPSSRHRL